MRGERCNGGERQREDSSVPNRRAERAKTEKGRGNGFATEPMDGVGAALASAAAAAALACVRATDQALLVIRQPAHPHRQAVRIVPTAPAPAPPFSFQNAAAAPHKGGPPPEQRITSGAGR